MATPPTRKSLDSDKNKASKEGADRSVFDRLVSPTSYTGTRKGKLNAQSQKAAQKDKQQWVNSAQQQPASSRAEEVAERMLDNLLRTAEDKFHSHPPSEPSSKINEYTQQNVFERLQKTTTQSFAVKHVPESGQEGGTPSQTSEKQKQEDGQKGKGVTKRIMSHASSTDSFKSSDGASSPSRHQSPSRGRGRASNGSNRGGIKSVQSKSPPNAQPRATDKTQERERREKKEDYAQQNVFERLTKTTTEAYAIKKRGGQKS